MGKKDKTSFGRALVKDRFGHGNKKKTVDNGNMLHTTAVQDGYDWGRLNLQSVTEESSFQEFLSTAQLANTEFQAEKLNLKLVNVNSISSVTTAEMRAKERKKHMESKHLLRVPRRPKWSRDMKAEEVQENERQSFLNWRRDLATLNEKDGLILTPYEKNLEFWRQLWRVLERSDVLIQVVDARNPLLFRCEDLESYAKEVGVKQCILLLNKSDLLTEEQRKIWVDYFDKEGIKSVFFSATLASEIEPSTLNDIVDSELQDIIEESDSENEESVEDVKKDENPVNIKNLISDINNLEGCVDETTEKIKDITSKIEKALSIKLSNEIDTDINAANASGHSGICSEKDLKKEISRTDILNREQLIDLLRNIEVERDGRLCVGLVGYPNVGKSSTINCLLNAKKVSVSATPGKTKHFQTLLLEDDLMLCDCPGLVLPSFVCTKADMIVYGILPIDQMREYMDPVNIVVECLGTRYQSEKRLGILLPPSSSEDPEALLPRDVLNAYAYSRGMMTGMGQPDSARAARVILRAAMKGVIPVAVPPPNYDAKDFMTSTYIKVSESEQQKRRQMTPHEAKTLKMNETSEDVDKRFFSGYNAAAHTRGVLGKSYGLPLAKATTEEGVVIDKPWKLINKHKNKNKRQKTKRMPYLNNTYL